MNELSFPGFLIRYVKGLSQANTLDIQKLAGEATTTNIRLQAPLVLYAVTSGKSYILKRHLQGKVNGRSMLRMLEQFSPENVETKLIHADAPREYLKVWDSYLVARDAPKRDAEAKAAMRERILQLQAETGIGIRQICREIGLSPCNVYIWLRDGVSTKVGYRSAKRILECLIQHQQENTNEDDKRI